MNLPNKITVSRLILIPIFTAVFFITALPANYFIAALIFVIAAATDALDGHIARSRNLVTNFGKFLDPIADKVLVSTAFIVLLTVPESFTKAIDCNCMLIVFAVCVAIIIARELIISGFRTIAADNGVVLAADKIGKLKAVFQDVAIFFLLLSIDFFSLATVEKAFNWIGIISFIICTVLTVISGVNYIVKNKQVIKDC